VTPLKFSDPLNLKHGEVKLSQILSTDTIKQPDIPERPSRRISSFFD